MILSPTELDQAPKDFVQVVFVLETGQIGHVRTADVDDKVVDVFV